MYKNRRAFLKNMGLGVAGTLAIPAQSWSKSKTSLETAIHELKEFPNPNSEQYWEIVASQFQFAQGLKYFNNASLGACPFPIRKATNTFRGSDP